MVALNGFVAGVALQFLCGKPSHIPVGIRMLAPETEEEKTRRQEASGGVRIVAPTWHCSLKGVAEGLKGAGYPLRDAFCRRRFGHRDFDGKHSAQFIFSKEGMIPIAADTPFAPTDAGQALDAFCIQAIWRLRAYLNPYHDDRHVLVGHTVQIVMDSRQPLAHSDRSPVMAYPRDNRGKPAGQLAPLYPAYRLCVEDGQIKLILVC